MKKILKFVLILKVFLCFNGTSATINIHGIVMDQYNRPIKKAIVKLSEQFQLSDTTDSNGNFVLSSTGITNFITTSQKSPEIHISPLGSIIINNNYTQNCEIKIISLQGRVTSLVYKGKLKMGIYKFNLKPFVRNSVFILNVKHGNRTINLKIPALISNNKEILNKNQVSTAENLKATLLVTHELYDEKKVEVSLPSDSIAIRLFKKLDFNTPETLFIGDTLSLNSKEMLLSLDSIADHRCPCSVLCVWEGYANNYFTLNIKDSSYHLNLKMYDSLEVNINQYKITLLRMNECPEERKEKYYVVIKVTPSYIRNDEFLLLEH